MLLLLPTPLLMALPAPSTSTPTWLPIPTVPLSLLTSPLLLLPVPTTSPPRELLTLLLDPLLLDPSLSVESMPMPAPQLPTAMVAPPNGAVVPVDEPAVAAARADHFAAKGGVY